MTADKRRITVGASSGSDRALKASQTCELRICAVVPAGIEPATFRV